MLLNCQLWGGTNMSALSTRLRRLGQRRRARQALPMIAIEVAEQAKRGRLDPDDAMPLYVAYYSGVTGATKIDVTLPTIKANASKLRQIIKARDPELLARVASIHAAVAHQRNVLPLYAVMVSACRERLATGRKLSDAQIRAMLAR